MKVWITRSEPGASRLAERLRDSGFVPLVAPVIGIERLRPESTTTMVAAYVCVVLSEHAVPAVGDVTPICGYLAIGRNTADALMDKGFSPVRVPQTEDSVGIIDWLEQNLPERPDAAVVIYSGEGGTQQVESYLRTKAQAFHRVNAYRRIHLPLDRSISDADVIVVSSGAALDAVRAHLGSAGLALSVPLVVPSPRVQAAAEAAGFVRIVLAKGASPEAIVEVLLAGFSCS
jgi:uroporphyrinogen-III synthase